jgi:nucleotide-binding universal stress UspA family protein
VPETRSYGRPRILIPLDGSALAERVLAHVERWVSPSAAELSVLRVIHRGHRGPLVRGDDAAAYHSALDQRADAASYLGRVRGRMGRRGYDVRVLVRTGDPVGEIVRAARTERAALIVMSTHARSGVRRVIVGSVAEGVLRRARLPCVLVPAGARLRRTRATPGRGRDGR